MAKNNLQRGIAALQITSGLNKKEVNQHIMVDGAIGARGIFDKLGNLVFSGDAPGLAATGALTSSSATAGVGYAAGAGGAVTQATSRSTGVTLNKVSGAITLVSAAGSATPFSFTLTNSAIAAGDTVIINQKSGTDKYTTQVVTNVAAGSCQITLANASGTTTEQPVFTFNVIRGTAA